MNKRLVNVLLTTAVFGGGLAAGLWIGSNRVPATPPPAWLYSEFNDITRPGLQIQDLIQSRPDLWKEINAELLQLKPRIDEFRGHIHDIDSDFRRDFEAILNEEQKARLSEAQLKRELPRIFTNFTPAPSAPASAANTGATKETDKALSDAKPAVNTSVAKATVATTPPAVPPTPAAASAPRVYHERSDGLVSSFVFVPYTSAKFSEVLDLDDDQEEKLNLLLAERRSRFLRLCDDTPPPSLQLNRIAEIIRKARQSAEKAK